MCMYNYVHVFLINFSFIFFLTGACFGDGNLMLHRLTIVTEKTKKLVGSEHVLCSGGGHSA